MMFFVILPLLIGTTTAKVYGNLQFTYCVADQRELAESLQAAVNKPSFNNVPARRAWKSCSIRGPMERFPRKMPNPCKSISITSNDNVLVWKGYHCHHSADWWNGNPAKGIKAHGGNPWLEKLELDDSWHGESQGVHAEKI